MASDQFHKSNVVFRTGETVILRPLEKEDIPTLLPWQNDPEVTQFLIRPFPMMKKMEEDWIDALSKDRNNVVLGIVRKADGKLIGTMGVHNINWQQRTATTGTIIGDKDCWGKGYGTEAKMLLLDFVFNALDLYAILSRVNSTNLRSLAYAKKSGYEEVGRLPRWIRLQNGERCDEVILMITQEKWKPLWKKYLSTKEPKEK